MRSAFRASLYDHSRSDTELALASFAGEITHADLDLRRRQAFQPCREGGDLLQPAARGGYQLRNLDKLGQLHDDGVAAHPRCTSKNRWQNSGGEMNFILFLIIRALAGWLAGQIMKGRGFGVIGNILVGVVGAFIGGFLFRVLGFAAFGLIAQLIMATIGAIILLWIAGYVRKRT